MNNTFSLRRVLLYARKHYVENSRSYLYLLSAFLVLLAIDTWVCGFHRPDSPGLMTCAIFCLLLFNGLIMRINCRSHYEPAQIPIAYTLPATALEKYLVIWFNSTIAPILLFALAMMPIAAITGFSKYLFEAFTFYTPWVLLLFVQSTVLLACCWAKGNPLKVLLPLAGAYILFFISYLWIDDSAFGLESTSISFIFNDGWVRMNSVTAGVSYRIREFPADELIYAIFWGFWALVNCVVAYFKFKERTLK